MQDFVSVIAIPREPLFPVRRGAKLCPVTLEEFQASDSRLMIGTWYRLARATVLSSFGGLVAAKRSPPC